MKHPDGTVIQSAQVLFPHDYRDQRIFTPMLGIVKNVYFSDHVRNVTAKSQNDQRGSRCEADVFIVNDGTHSPMLVQNVVVLPQGASGIDNFTEEIPRGITATIDGSQFTNDLTGVSRDSLDGDWCIVQFIGGSINQPIMTSWFPHPRNVIDPATLSLAPFRESSQAKRTLFQGERYFKRFAGSKFIITAAGDLHIDTSQAGRTLVCKDNKLKRIKLEKGGNIQVDVKSSAQFELNLNEVAETPETNPAIPQTNPPELKEQDREDTLSKLLVNKDFINAVAGRVVQIMGNNDGTDKKDTVLLGENPNERGHLIFGDRFREDDYNDFVKRMTDFIEAYDNHIHGSPNGNTTKPISSADGSAPSSSSYKSTCFSEPILLGGTGPATNPIYTACNLGPAGPLTGDLGGPEFILDEVQETQHNASGSGTVTVPPPSNAADQFTPNEMPPESVSEVSKTE